MNAEFVILQPLITAPVGQRQSNYTSDNNEADEIFCDEQQYITYRSAQYLANADFLDPLGYRDQC